MRLLLLYLVLSSLFLSACRQYDDDLPKNPPFIAPYDLLTSNGRDIKDSVVIFDMKDSQANYLTTVCSRITGDTVLNDSATVYLTGLPTGATATPAIGTFKLYDEGLQQKIEINTNTGLYPINIHVNTKFKGAQVFPAMLHVLPDTDCVPDFVDNWISYISCSYDSCVITITAIAGMPHWARMSNINGLGDSVYANIYIKCNYGIVIPLQTHNGYTFYGRRTLDEIDGPDYHAFTLPDTVIHSGDTITCGTFLSRLN